MNEKLKLTSSSLNSFSNLKQHYLAVLGLGALLKEGRFGE